MPADANEATLERLCQEHSARLRLWLAEQKKPREDGQPQIRLTPYDGTVSAACRIYQEHPDSDFRAVKHNTRRSYTDSLKIIEASVGKRLIRNVTVIDVKRWYREWRKPAHEGGPERKDRAHDAVSMLKTVLRFNASLRRPDCKQLADELALTKFEKGGARQEEMTSGHVGAFRSSSATAA